MKKLYNYLNTKGMTLIEILVSIVLIGIILTVFINFFSQSTFYNSKVSQNLTAVNIAEKVVFEVSENIKNVSKTIVDEKCSYINNLDFLQGIQGESNSKFFSYNNQSFYPYVKICEVENPKNLTNIYLINVQIKDQNNNVISELNDYGIYRE